MKRTEHDVRRCLSNLRRRFQANGQVLEYSLVMAGLLCQHAYKLRWSGSLGTSTVREVLPWLALALLGASLALYGMLRSLGRASMGPKLFGVIGSVLLLIYWA